MKHPTQKGSDKASHYFLNSYRTCFLLSNMLYCVHHCKHMFSLLLCRAAGFWLSRSQSLLYCNEHGVLGSFSEEVKSCSCPAEQPTCQGVIPCIVGTSSTSCSSCASDNATRCGACHHGNLLHLGSCRPSIATSLDHYLNLDLDMPDAEVWRVSQLLIYVFHWFSNLGGTSSLIS